MHYSVLQFLSLSLSLSTNSVRFFLLPALLGDLTLQLSEGDRLGIISKARIYCVDYLQRCKSYAITSEVDTTMHAILVHRPSQLLHTENLEKLRGLGGHTCMRLQHSVCIDAPSLYTHTYIHRSHHRVNLAWLRPLPRLVQHLLPLQESLMIRWLQREVPK